MTIKTIIFMEQILWTARKVFHVIIAVPNQLFCFIAYFSCMLTVLPLWIIHRPTYWVIEGYIYKWILTLIGGGVMLGGVTGQSNVGVPEKMI